jgi:hypothetical protein
VLGIFEIESLELFALAGLELRSSLFSAYRHQPLVPSGDHISYRPPDNVGALLTVHRLLANHLCHYSSIPEFFILSPLFKGPQSICLQATSLRLPCIGIMWASGSKADSDSRGLMWAVDFAYLTSLQIMLVLPSHRPHFEKQDLRMLSFPNISYILKLFFFFIIASSRD